MLGHRGCRLGNTYPEITEMQTQAILGAAIQLKKAGHGSASGNHGSIDRYRQRV
jgi:phosphoenolpyruvate synthase/pyruvate phosphate dikinase